MAHGGGLRINDILSGAYQTFPSTDKVIFIFLPFCGIQASDSAFILLQILM